MLDIANIIEDDTGKLVQFRQFLWESEIPLRSQQSLNQTGRTGPPHRMTSHDEFIGHRSQSMALPNAGFAHGNHINSVVQKSTTLEALDLQLQGGGEPFHLEGAKGLLQGESGL